MQWFEGKADAVLHYLWDERVFLGHDRNARKWARVVSVA